MVATATLAAVVVAVLVVVADDPDVTDRADTAGEGSYSPRVDPADFTTQIDNPYLPLVPGRRWVYRGRSDEGEERDVVEVTRRTREVMGVRTVVVRDRVWLEDELLEDTFDWYAQDRNGNVWYFGEETKEFDHGRVSTEGSWEAGVDGAEPGIAVPAHPEVGDRYRQEYLPGVAEDMVEVLSVDERAQVPAGAFDHLLMTKDFTPLEPDVVEHKYYARGIGVVSEVVVQGGSERVELVSVTG